MSEAGVADTYSGAAEGVRHERFDVAMTLGGFSSYASLGAATGLSTDTFWRWNRALVEQPLAQSRMATEAALPVTYAFLTDTAPLPELRSVRFRSLTKADEFERDIVRAYLRVLATTAKRLLGTRPVGLLTMLSTVRRNDRSAAHAAAAGFRARVGLTHATPAPDLVDLAESLGVVVAYAPRGDKLIDACSAWTENDLPLIALNPAKGDALRQRWDMAHELGHLVMHHDDRAMNNRTAEAQADAFAEAFLLPQHRDVRNELMTAIPRRADKGDPLTELLALQDKWGMSVDSLLHIATRTAPPEDRPRVVAAQAARIALAPKSEPLGTRPVPEIPRALADAVAETQSTYGTMFAAIAHDLGLKPELLRTILSQHPGSGG